MTTVQRISGSSSVALIIIVIYGDYNGGYKIADYVNSSMVCSQTLLFLSFVRVGYARLTWFIFIASL